MAPQQWKTPPEMAIDPKKNYTVTFETDRGPIEISLAPQYAPVTVNNFVFLVQQGFYDGVSFHRVINNFVIQGGDPTGTGTGGPGYTIPDEFNAKASNVTGAFGMANAGPNTAGSQFYINLKNNLNLNANYPVFGIVISNMEVVQQIGLVPVNSSSRPLTPVVMDSVRISKPGPLGINESITENESIIIFPNPATDFIDVMSQGKVNLVSQISVYNTLGECVMKLRPNELPLRIDISCLNKGIYFVRISDQQNKTIMIKNVIVQ